MNKNFGPDRVYILPIVIDDSPLPKYVTDRRYADFRKSSGKGLSDLLEVLVGNTDLRCLLFRQEKACLPIRGTKQKIEIKNYSEVIFHRPLVPVIVTKTLDSSKCFFGLTLENLKAKTLSNVKVTVKPVDSTKRILESRSTDNQQIIEGGIGSNYVSFNIKFIYPHDQQYISLASSSSNWPEVIIVGEGCIWDGRIYKIDIFPGDYSPS